MKLVMLEDDRRLAGQVAPDLRRQGFHVVLLETAAELRELIESAPMVDFFLLDRLIGSFDSKELLPLVRKRWPSTPILVLSAISTPQERTEVLNLGADDYLGKPFSTSELQARIRALVRRMKSAPSNYLAVGGMIIDVGARTISCHERHLALPEKEFLLLRTLAQEEGRVWNKSDLLDYVWGVESTTETNVVEVTVANLRKRLAQVGANVSIRNLRNAGYWLES